jgi:hypothetical protein
MRLNLPASYGAAVALTQKGRWGAQEKQARACFGGEPEALYGSRLCDGWCRPSS